MRRPSTDSDLSIESREFVWADEDPTSAYSYILPVVLHWLREGGAKRVLDIGCGNGVLTHELAKAGYEITGIDSSASGLALASKAYPEIRFLQAGVESPLPEELKGRFEALIAVEVIEHLLLPRELFRRAKEALGVRGRLIVSTPYHGYLKNLALALANKYDAHWHPLRDYGHVKFFSIDTLSRLFQEQGFRVCQTRRVGRVPLLEKSMIIEGVLE